jgi:3-hydroxy acid dehydrogenase/malonic semialdehyde reductase
MGKAPLQSVAGLHVLITGAAQGMGLLFAKRACREGAARVVIWDIDTARLDAAAEELRRLGGAVEAYVVDLADPAQIHQYAAQAVESGGIDVLVNNAGLAMGKEKAHEADFQDWRTMIDTNVTGLALVTHAFLPGMVARKRGLVINIGSVAGKYPYPGGNVYGATKAFVAQFSRNLRADLIGTGVRVTDVQPGLVGETEFSLVRYKGDKERTAAMYAGAHPLRPEDIAETVAWVASLPPHVNVNAIEVMPTSQSFAALTVTRDE